LRRLECGSIKASAREINDPVWSTISLSPFESLFIDSPLFQRLRRIRQLGVVHWVYPGALHTRFEHSIGTLHQVQQLIDSINRSAPGSINIEYTTLLRFAALCHDLGHGSTSHVSEKALSRRSEVSSILLEFGQKEKIERPALAEVVAYFLIGSPAFIQLFQYARAACSSITPGPDSIEQVKNIVVGRIVDPKMPLLQELISGPFDADKLDYMQRDAFMAGVPAITDVPRLVRKVRAVAVSEAQLPKRFTTTIESTSGTYTLFGLAQSGARTLDELLIARVMLFDKIYRHHKVRSLEGMVCRLYDALCECYKGAKYEVPYIFSDDILLDLQTVLRDGRFDDSHPSFAVALELSSKLKQRDTYVRAFAFGKHFPELQHDESARIGMDRFIGDVEGDIEDNISQAIAEEVKKVARLLKQRPLLKKFKDTSLRSYIWIDPPSKTDHGKKVAHALLIGENSEIFRYSDHSVEVPNWSQGYLSKKDIGFIYCPEELKELVFLATEKLLAEKYSVSALNSAKVHFKVDKVSISEKREELRTKRFYNKLAHSLRPTPPRLLAIDAKDTCEAVLSKLYGHSPPISNPGEKQIYPLTADRIIRWLGQFENNADITSALTLIQSIQLVGRLSYVTAVKNFIERNRKFESATIVPLGDARDSGSTVAYLVGDLGLNISSLTQALDDRQPLIFVDDFIGSGEQASDIVRSWFSKSAGVQNHEGPRMELSPSQQNKLRERPVSFVFASGWTSGAARLKTECSDLQFFVETDIGINEDSVPSIDSVADIPAEFKERCRSIGKQLLQSTNRSWPVQRYEERALGYGNKGLLVTFPFNTPTQTLTCIWSEGAYNGFRWMPLLPRRKKK